MKSKGRGWGTRCQTCQGRRRGQAREIVPLSKPKRRRASAPPFCCLLEKTSLSLSSLRFSHSRSVHPSPATQEVVRLRWFLGAALRGPSRYPQPSTASQSIAACFRLGCWTDRRLAEGKVLATRRWITSELPVRTTTILWKPPHSPMPPAMGRFGGIVLSQCAAACV